MIGAHDQHPGQFAVRPGRRLECDGRKAADLFQPILQRVHQRQVALDGLDGLQGVCVQEAWQAAGVFVDLGVVLHRARTQRVKAAVHAVVEGAQVHVVPDHVHFGQLGQGQVRSQQGFWQLGAWHVRFRESDAGASG